MILNKVRAENLENIYLYFFAQNNFLDLFCLFSNQIKTVLYSISQYKPALFSLLSRFPEEMLCQL